MSNLLVKEPTESQERYTAAPIRSIYISAKVEFLYIGFMFFASVNLVDEALLIQTYDLLLAFIVLYLTVPRNILSVNAVRAKDSIRTFRKALSKQEHILLHKEDKWIIRAYLFKRSRSSYPLEAASTGPLVSFWRRFPWRLFNVFR